MNGWERRTDLRHLEVMPWQWPAPGRCKAAWIGWRAKRVPDPVARLRLLRQSLERDGAGKAGPPALRGIRAVAGAVAVLMALAPLGAVRDHAAEQKVQEPRPVAAPARAEKTALPDVWVVDQQPEYELYSNGLRVEREYETTHEPRRYEVFARGREEDGPVEERTEPAGIVFHSTESAMAEFRADQATRLKLLGRYLLQYVREERAYHYLIDRFGRVWRIVREADAANHAGHSLWADDRWTYINLNRSFFGVSLEGRSGDPGGGQEPVTRGQEHALRLLTEMLRSRYSIAAVNCVTHAQVSINPSNRQAGYHYDWASGFPYAAIGLPDNYLVPSPSAWLFGFTWDSSMLRLASEPFRNGLQLGQDRFRQSAAGRGMEVELYAQARHKVLRQILARLKAKAEPPPEFSARGSQ